jgi:hypothetical protein
LGRHISGDFRPLALYAIVKKAEPAPTQRGRAALRPIYLYVLTAWNIVHPHIFLSSFRLAGWREFADTLPHPLKSLQSSG